MSGSKVEILVRKSLLERVYGAVGTPMFRSLYALVDGKEVDILGNGRKSCALFVSSILVGFGLIESVHATVQSTILDMEHSGWERLPHAREGCVILWKGYLIDGEPHDHIGFYVGDVRAISNSSSQGTPQEHDSDLHEVVALYWHPRLGN